PRLAWLANALGDYQTALSLFFEAIRSKTPKQTAKLSTDAIAQSSLDFGYTFAGSVGFVLTIPNERLLEMENDLDEAVQLIFEVSKAQTPPEILNHAKRLGKAPIRAIFRWADSHVKALFSADIEWRRGRSLRKKTIIQNPEFERLQQTLLQTSEETTTEIT